MNKCFVMQPFDGGPYDLRYESVFAPAITAAGLSPYHVDRDPSVSIPILEIENGIRNADICFAEITTDNPNVWFELGFAFAIPREVIMVSSDERKSKYPFDIQHRNIIHYSTNAPQDFDKLKHSITERLAAVLKKQEEIGRAASLSPVKDTEGLSQHEIVALVTVMQNSFLSGGYTPAFRIKEDMNSAGFTDIAVGISLRTLATKGMLSSDTFYTEDDNSPYFVYKPAAKGEQWLIDNQDKLTLKTPPPPPLEIPF